MFFLPEIALTIENNFGQIISSKLISNSNNRVSRIDTTKGVFLVKEIYDVTADALFEQEILKRVGTNDRFRKLFFVKIFETLKLTLVVAEYLEGTPLDEIVSTGNYTVQESAQWAKTICEIHNSLANIEAVGFGRPKLNHSEISFSSLSEFLNWYLEKQVLRGPKMATLRYQKLKKIFEILIPMLDKINIYPKLISADVNSKNFLITLPDRELKIIHLPNIWHADPAIPFGEALVHLDGSQLLDELLKLKSFENWRLYFYASFSAYIILVFVERFSNISIKIARPWGASRPLFEILDDYLEKLEFEIEKLNIRD